MKPKVIDKMCGAGKDACEAIKKCPVGAVSYIEVEEPIHDRNVNCNKTVEKNNSESSCGCGCNCNDDSTVCGGTPYSRIIIDYNICNSCGICVNECCGNAIEMIA